MSKIGPTRLRRPRSVHQSRRLRKIKVTRLSSVKIRLSPSERSSKRRMPSNATKEKIQRPLTPTNWKSKLASRRTNNLWMNRPFSEPLNRRCCLLPQPCKPHLTWKRRSKAVKKRKICMSRSLNSWREWRVYGRPSLALEAALKRLLNSSRSRIFSE